MRTFLRGKRTGLIVFGFICALVIGGLGWVTHAALCLEQEQAETRAAAEHAEKRRLWQREHEHQAELERRERQQRETDAQTAFAVKLRLALWRLDSRITPTLAREDTRPYSHYSAIFAPSIVLDNKGNVELEDYYLRAKVIAASKTTPGETVNLQIESIDPSKGEVRFRMG